LVVNLTPLIPLSILGEGEENKRGADAPLRHPLSTALELSGKLEGANAPSKTISPLPLVKGKGI
jgi:hypothetical protein